LPLNGQVGISKVGRLLIHTAIATLADVMAALISLISVNRGAKISATGIGMLRPVMVILQQGIPRGIGPGGKEIVIAGLRFGNFGICGVGNEISIQVDMMILKQG
jgi:hypothetical protein